MDKIKTELTAITEKHELAVKLKLNEKNETDTYFDKMKILIESREKHFNEISKYYSEKSLGLDSTKQYEIETMARSNFTIFDNFLSNVPI